MTGRVPRVRPPAVAGTFYPRGEGALREALDDAFRKARHDVHVDGSPKAVIAPHAGYVYSGPIAATAYEQLAPARAVIRRIVLLGPSHRVPLRGIAASSADAFDTPLGAVPVDTARRDAVLRLPGVLVADAAHDQEHSLEVHLPFLQRVLDDFAVLPLVVGVTSPATVAAVLDAVWGGPETRIVVSSDLSHYHDHATAVRLDAATADAIVHGRLADIDDYDACGAYPVRGLLMAAAEHGLRVETLDLRNSGDTAGPTDRVVGYGAFALT
ncbi:MAG TPA: AmmeMemoRadiSam system protein B [Acidimicrobiales bacterium]|nr:AmmeMemoRadiSam system protein B [Acidimicrobiales bacterium]